jgi:oligopeptide/dipeptide ABC transporter ATP-binding protein
MKPTSKQIHEFGLKSVMNDKSNDYVLMIKDLHIHYHTNQALVRAVNGVSLSVRRGTTVALVGESGCGKTVTAYSVLKLIEKPGEIVKGSITLFPRTGGFVDVLALTKKSQELYRLRGSFAGIVFQEPMTALSPVHSIGNQICEAVRVHKRVSRKTAEEMAIDMLGRVGIPDPSARLKQYPHEISGGMRQRVVIAMALVCRPELLIADEPTTALDVTIQAEIMNLIKNLRQQLDISVLLITHDLALVAQNADEVAVMYLGRIVEHAPVRDIIKWPRHPYTKALLKSLPGLSQKGQRLVSIRGSVPSASRIPSGCPFHTRCDYARDGICDIGKPPELCDISPGHKVACVRAKEIGVL